MTYRRQILLNYGWRRNYFTTEEYIKLSKFTPAQIKNDLEKKLKWRNGE